MESREIRVAFGTFGTRKMKAEGQRSLKGGGINDTSVRPLALLKKARRRLEEKKGPGGGKRGKKRKKEYEEKRKHGGAADGIYCSRRKYSKGVTSMLLGSRKPEPRRVYFNVYFGLL